MTVSYYEDIRIGEERKSGDFLVNKDEIILYAEQWDPRPFHVDEAAAKSSIFQGLIASSTHTIAIAFRLLNQAWADLPVVGGLGWDEVRFPIPIRPDDRLFLVGECIEKRDSQSRPECGILRFELKLMNQEDETVCRCTITFLAAKRSHRSGLGRFLPGPLAKN